MKYNYEKIIFIILLLVSSSLTLSPIDVRLAYVGVIAISSLTVLLFVNPSSVSINKRAVIPLLTIFVFFIIQIMVAENWEPVGNDLVRTLVFMLYGVFIIFYLPTHINLDEFLFAVLIVSSGFTIFGLLLALFNINILGFTPFDSGFDLISAERINPFTSIFNNPNAIGNLTKYGLVSGVILSYRSQYNHILPLIFISLIGLVFSQARIEILAGSLSVALYLIYQYKSRRLFQYTYIFGLLAGCLIFLYVLGSPEGNVIKSLLPRRRFLWSASLEALSQKPFFGYGLGYTGDYIEPVYSKSEVISVGLNPDMYLGSHNSFLRIFLSIGVVGGLSYVYLFVYSVFLQIKSVESWESAGILCLLSCVIASHMLQANLIFGLRMQSILAAIILGYALKTYRPNKKNLAF